MFEGYMIYGLTINELVFYILITGATVIMALAAIALVWFLLQDVINDV